MEHRQGTGGATRGDQQCHPTLVIAGSYDAITSPQSAEAAARPIPASTLIVIPGVGHYVLPKSDCAQKVMQAFVDNPKAKPDVSCVGRGEEKISDDDRAGGKINAKISGNRQSPDGEL